MVVRKSVLVWRALACCGALVVLLCSGPDARASDPAAAKELFDKGRVALEEPRMESSRSAKGV